MIVVINSKGKVVAQQFEDLYQGSVKANTIELIAPFADNVIFKANIELPDGTLLPENLDGYVFKKSITVSNGLNVWTLPIEYPVSKLYGTVIIQIRAEVGNQIICTSTIKMPIQEGVPYNKTQDIEPTQYDVLSQMIADVQAGLINKVSTYNRIYEEIEATAETEGYYWVKSSTLGSYVPVLLPDMYEEGETYYIDKCFSRIVNGGDNIILEYGDNENSTILELSKSGVTINDKKVVTLDDFVAENVSYNNEQSGINAGTLQEAVDEIVKSIDDLENVGLDKKLDKAPNGKTNLINSQTGKIDKTYIPSGLSKGLTFAGTFAENGIIIASAYAPELNLLSINEIEVAQIVGYEFQYVGEGVYTLGNLELNKNDIIVCNGAELPNWTLIDNSDKVVSVNGQTGAVEVTTESIGAVAEVTEEFEYETGINGDTKFRKAVTINTNPYEINVKFVDEKHNDYDIKFINNELKIYKVNNSTGETEVAPLIINGVEVATKDSIVSVLNTEV